MDGGVLVQANHGRRDRLSIGGMPVGRAIPTSIVPSPWEDVSSRVDRSGSPPPGSGSIIVVVATDAPLLPHQCERLAQRAGLGIARVGGSGAHTSGDLFLCFATGNRGLSAADDERGQARTRAVRALADPWISPLFWAVIEATEEAIVNALVAARTMTGRDGITAHAVPHDRLRRIVATWDVMEREIERDARSAAGPPPCR